MQFLQQDALQLVRDLVFSRVDPRLRQKAAQVDILDFQPKFVFRGHGHPASGSFTAI
jgi:hypothetical protein